MLHLSKMSSLTCTPHYSLPTVGLSVLLAIVLTLVLGGSQGVQGATNSGGDVDSTPTVTEDILRINDGGSSSVVQFQAAPLEGPDYEIHGYNWATPSGSTFYGGVIIGDDLWMNPFTASSYPTKVNKLTGEVTSYTGWPVGFSSSTDNRIRTSVFDGTHLWYLPYDGNMLVRVNPSTGAMDGYAKSGQLEGGSCDGRGYIWMTPRGYSGGVLRLTISTQSFTDFNVWPSGFSWSTAALSGAAFDGMSHWMAKAYSDRVVGINTETGDMKGYLASSWPSSITLPASSNFLSLVHDGRTGLYLLPCVSNFIVHLDTVTGTAIGHSNWPSGFTGVGGCITSGGIFDGRYLWISPRSQTMLLRFDTQSTMIENLSSLFPNTFVPGVNPFFGMSYDPATHSAWFIPSTANMVLRLTSTTFTVTVSETRTPSAPVTASLSRTQTPGETESVVGTSTRTRAETASTGVTITSGDTHTAQPTHSQEEQTPSSSIGEIPTKTRLHNTSTDSFATSSSSSSSWSLSSSLGVIESPSSNQQLGTTHISSHVSAAYEDSSAAGSSTSGSSSSSSAFEVSTTTASPIQPSLVVSLQSLGRQGTGASTDVTLIPVVASVTTINGQADRVTIDCVPVTLGQSSLIVFNPVNSSTLMLLPGSSSSSSFSLNNYSCESAYPGVHCEVPAVAPPGVELVFNVTCPSYYLRNLTVECTLTADNTVPKSSIVTLLLQEEEDELSNASSAPAVSVTTAPSTYDTRNLFGSNSQALQCFDPVFFTIVGIILCMLGSLIVTSAWRRSNHAATATSCSSSFSEGGRKVQGRSCSLCGSLLLHHSYIQLFLPCKVECVISHSFLICSHMMSLLFLVALMAAAGFYSPAATDAYQWGAAVLGLLVLTAIVQPLCNFFYLKTADDFVLEESLKYLSSPKALGLAQQRSQGALGSTKLRSSSGGKHLECSAGATLSTTERRSSACSSGANMRRSAGDLEDDMVYIATETDGGRTREEEESEKKEKRRLLVASLRIGKQGIIQSVALEQSMSALDDIQLEEDNAGGTTTFGSSTNHSSSEGVGTLTFGSTSGGLGGTTDSNTGTATGLTGTGTGTAGSQQPVEEVTAGDFRMEQQLAKAEKISLEASREGVHLCTPTLASVEEINEETTSEIVVQGDRVQKPAPLGIVLLDGSADDNSPREPPSKKEGGDSRSTFSVMLGGEEEEEPEGRDCVATHIELAEVKLLEKYRAIGHSINGAVVVLTTICTYLIIVTGASLSRTNGAGPPSGSGSDGGGGGLSSQCDFFVFSLWKAILLDIFCAQPMAMMVVLGYRWSNSIDEGEGHRKMSGLHP